MKVDDLKLKVRKGTVNVKKGDHTFKVRTYLTIPERTDLIQFVVSNSLDMNSGTFSPLRVDLYYALGICRFYAGLEFDLENAADVYDTLETNGIIAAIETAIPKGEINFMQNLVQETVTDISRYNSSAIGIIQAMKTDTGELDKQIQDLLKQLQQSDEVKEVGQKVEKIL